MATKNKFRTQFDPKLPKEETFPSPSLTTPDQSMSVRTIIKRFTNGMSMPFQRELTFSEDNEDLRGLDITEIYEMRAENQREINYLQNSIEEYEKSELSKSEKIKLEKLKEQWKKEFESENSSS